MNNILFVSGSLSIIPKIEKYIKNGTLDQHKVFFAIEFFDKKVPNNLPMNCFPVKDFLDQIELSEIGKLILNRGDFSYVIALDESSLYAAADLRKRLGCRGPDKSELEKFRDKVVMKTSLIGSGVRTPKLYSRDDITNGNYELPLIAKPKAYCGSIGVRLIQSQNEIYEFLDFAPKPKPEAYDHSFSELARDEIQYEEFIEGSIYQIDGLVLNGKIKFVVASKYFNSCLDFINGHPVGSIIVDDTNEQSSWAQFASDIIKTMKCPDGAFHLEAFLTPKRERVFLEIACRLPGGLTIDMLELVLGVDLRLLHIQAQMGRLHKNFEPKKSNFIGGQLIFPMKYIDEGKIPGAHVRSIKLPNESKLTTLIWHKYPAVGSAAENEFAYEHNLGGFIFKGHDYFSVEQDIHRIVEEYHVEVIKND